MKYKYNERIFDASENQIIDKIIKLGASKDLLDTITLSYDYFPIFTNLQLAEIKKAFEYGLDKDEISLLLAHNNKYAAYSYSEMRLMVDGFINGLSIDQVQLYSKLNKNGDPIYSSVKAKYIYDGLINGYDEYAINMYAKLNKDEKPVFNTQQIKEIYKGVSDISKRNMVKLYTELNENREPIYSAKQMNAIRIGIKNGLAEDEVEIYAQLHNGQPLFSTREMNILREFIEHADSKYLSYLKNCIDDGLKNDEIIALFRFSSKTKAIPLENIRIYRSLFSIIPNGEYVKNLIRENTEYDTLKEYKYLFNCIDHFGYLNDPCLFINKPYSTTKDISDVLCEKIYEDYGINNSDSQEFINKIVSYKMDPEQIKYIASLYPYCGRMKIASIALLEGISLEDVKKENANSKTDKELKERFENKIKENITKGMFPEEHYEFDSNKYFENLER